MGSDLPRALRCWVHPVWGTGSASSGLPAPCVSLSIQCRWGCPGWWIAMSGLLRGKKGKIIVKKMEKRDINNAWVTWERSVCGWKALKQKSLQQPVSQLWCVLVEIQWLPEKPFTNTNTLSQESDRAGLLTLCMCRYMCLPYVHTIIKYRSVVGVFHGFGGFHKTNFKVVAEYFLRGTTLRVFNTRNLYHWCAWITLPAPRKYCILH